MSRLLILLLCCFVASPVLTATELSEAEIQAQVLRLGESAIAESVVAEMIASGDVRVSYIFQRLLDRSVVTYQERLFWRSGTNTVDGAELVSLHPLTTPLPEAGTPIAAAAVAQVASDAVERFREARQARRPMLEALRLIALYDTDPLRRGQAVRDLGNKGVQEALPRLQELAQSDPDPTVKRQARVSAAMLLLKDPSAASERRIEAAQWLGEESSLRARATLQEAAEDADATLAKSIATALAAIARHQRVVDWSGYLFSGLSLGSILLLTSLGLAVTFGLMGVINMAHGEMLMLGAVTAWACYEFLGGLLPPDWHYLIALPASFLVAAAAGLIIEATVVRFLYKRPLDSLLATIGVSYILIQAVRSWKGDNLGYEAPSWFSGGWEIAQDIVLPYNRLFIICLTIACVLAVVALFKYTRFGLMLRATVQNREMAAAAGVNTRLVDMLTFALGSGIAGIAGCALVLMTNPTPEMGQSYIVKSFLVVVVGGVGNILGVIVSALGLGFIEKIVEPMVLITQPIRIFDSTWAQVLVLLLVVIFIQRRPGGLFPERGRMADRADSGAGAFTAILSRRTDLILIGIIITLGLVVVPLLYGTGQMSPEYVTKLGYILTFAICAIGLDLLWGYTGVLSLCQFLFFTLGAYCMGLYMAMQGSTNEAGVPYCLSYLSSEVGGASLPWFLPLFDNFFSMLFLGMLLPGLLALIIGLTTFRSRVKGVYFAILTQAITVGANLIFMKNDLKLGGTNGLTGFEVIFGARLAPSPEDGPFLQTRFWLYIASFVVLLLAILLGRGIARSGLGRVLVAARDDETRLRFSGYRIWAWKTIIFVIAAMLGAIGGMLYAPQKGIITPGEMKAFASIQVVAWVALGGRGTIWGAVLGALVIGLGYDWITSSWPEGWMFLLGLIFILVPLLMPGGLIALGQQLLSRRQKPGALAPLVSSRGGAA